MEALVDMINSQLQDETSSRMIFIAMIALAVMVFCFSLFYLISALTAPFRHRVNALTHGGEQPVSADDRSHFKSMDPFARYLVPSQSKNLSVLKTKMLHAGIRSESAITTYYALKIVLTFSFFAGAVFLGRQMPEWEAQQEFLIGMSAAAFGYILPGLVVEKMAANRIRLIRNAFPDALDLLVVCVESGLGLAAALQRVAQELDVSHAELAGELNLVNAEIRAGINRMDALKDMAFRTGVDDIKGLVALLDQSVKFGGSIADTLRVYSEEFRDKRMQKAEEMAAKIGTKMIFPLTFCLWPGFFLVAIGPAVLNVLEVMKQ